MTPDMKEKEFSLWREEIVPY